MQQNPEKRKPGGRVLSLCALLVLILAIPAVLIATLLLFQAETWLGRLFATSVLLLYLAGCFLVRWLHKSGGMACVIIGAIACAGFITCYVGSPSGATPIGSKLHSVFPRSVTYCRWSPVNLVPEIDQVKLGALLSPFGDSLMTRARAKRMNTLFMASY